MTPPTKERLDLANWLSDTINDGFTYYTYTVNVSDPENPTKVAGNTAHIDFITNERVSLGQSLSEIDAHRHQITINVFFTGA